MRSQTVCETKANAPAKKVGYDNQLDFNMSDPVVKQTVVKQTVPIFYLRSGYASRFFGYGCLTRALGVPSGGGGKSRTCPSLDIVNGTLPH